jgi:Zn-dependent protease with chaperone function
MLAADYFDGRTTRVRRVSLQAAGEDLVLTGEDIDVRVPFAQVQVDERLGRAPRRLRFRDGTFCEVSDLHALDALLAATAHRDGWVDRMQRHLQFVLLSMAACAVLAVAGYKWGLPWVAAKGAANMPMAISKILSDQTLRILDNNILLPSGIVQERQQTLNAKFHALQLPDGGRPHAELLFRRSPQLGANAFTLPDGTIVVLDDLVTLLDDDEQILATFAHEEGHVNGHHGLQLMLQSSVVGTFLAFYIGDISSLLAVAPATLMQAKYSRELEQQADDYAANVLALNGMRVASLAEALEKLAKSHPQAAQPGYLSSHPATDERMRHLRALSAGPCATAASLGAAPLDSPAHFGASVYVFNPRMPLSQIQGIVDRVAKRQISNQFGHERYALLFEPGTYGSRENPLNFQVGYYTAVAGLGASPTEVIINGSVQVRNRCFHGSCVALDNFWRSLTNLTINVASRSAGCYAGEIWAVSQAAPMRRVRVTGGDVRLTDSCSAPSYASGGFIADSDFDGKLINGTQQQFMVRNSKLNGWSNGNWNQVFSGVLGAPAPCSPTEPSCGPYTTLAASPATREAPFIYMDSRKQYHVMVPSVQNNTAGTTWAEHSALGESISLAKFYIATPRDTAATINSALALDKNLILSPGIYHLNQSIIVARADSVILGLGFPTLIAEQGVVAMRVSASRGVSISGIIFDAGETTSAELLRVGEPNTPVNDDSADPTALHDVFFRIGGAQRGRATMSLVVNSGNVILDHIWAWRADHGHGVGWTSNTAATGIVINGNDVTAYGLFVEHYQKHEVIWNGDNGTVIFFQNEMPYDPPSQEAWREARDAEGYPAIKVLESVKRFRGYGMGSYSYFNRGVQVYATNAFSVPHALASSSLHGLFTIFLNASASGGIRNVVNNQGGSSTKDNADIPVRVLSYP